MYLSGAVGIRSNTRWRGIVGRLAEMHLTIHGWPHDPNFVDLVLPVWKVKPPGRTGNEWRRLELLDEADLELRPMSTGEPFNHFVFHYISSPG